ncbi:hypothetical protein [Phenylobacterium sp.]|uniref:hypothetical protein n=1 Tax=Phenylobacterium sp. TaxID=1871053 RepID=UPI002FDB5AEC
MTVVELEAYRQGRGRVAGIDPAVADIMQVLADCGGALHRKEVAVRIAERRGCFARPERELVEAEVFTAFQRYMTFAATRRQPPLLSLPFGPGSYRWSLTDAGAALLRKPAEKPLAQPSA